MNREHGRRAFVRNVMIGIPAVAGSASLLAAADAAPAPVAAGGLLTTVDRRIETVIQQMADLHNEMRGRMPSAADARRAAEYIRALIGYRREAGRDAQVSSAFQKLIEDRGVESLVSF